MADNKFPHSPEEINDIGYEIASIQDVLAFLISWAATVDGVQELSEREANGLMVILDFLRTRLDRIGAHCACVAEGEAS